MRAFLSAILILSLVGCGLTLDSPLVGGLKPDMDDLTGEGYCLRDKDYNPEWTEEICGICHYIY